VIIDEDGRARRPSQAEILREVGARAAHLVDRLLDERFVAGQALGKALSQHGGDLFGRWAAEGWISEDEVMALRKLVRDAAT